MASMAEKKSERVIDGVSVGWKSHRFPDRKADAITDRAWERVTVHHSVASRSRP
jgi:hypothetical protein